MKDQSRRPDALPNDGAQKPRQRRTELRRGAIERAAIAVIGGAGVSRLTHRSVAREAKVPLASTTYHYSTGKDIVAAASGQLLRTYARDFARLARRLATKPDMELAEVVLRTVIGGVDKHRTATLAWCEIILNCAWDETGQALAREWFDTVLTIWTEIARMTGSPDPECDAQSAIDTATGLALAVLPLGISGDMIAAVLCPGGAALRTWAPPAEGASLPGTQARGQKRGDLTRDRIVAAAATIVAEAGAGEVTLRRVAAQAGVSAAAPSYYFPTAADLLNATLSQLFENAKSRYRDAMSTGKARPTDDGQLADLTAAIFLRESTEYRGVALAGYALRMEAARQPKLREAVWNAIDDQSAAWAKQLTAAGIDVGERCGLVVQGLFLGKLVRILATRATTSELAAVRREFVADFAALQRGAHWAKKWYI